MFRPRDGGTWSAGDRLVAGPDLGKTLRRIAGDGADAFYKGSVADLIAAEMKAGGGLITKEDLDRLQGGTSANRSMALIAAMTSMARRRPVPAASAWSRC